MAKSRSSEDLEEQEFDAGTEDPDAVATDPFADEPLTEPEGGGDGGLAALLGGVAPVTDAGRASAVRLLDLLIEKKALALHKKKPGKRLIEKVAQVLESRGPLQQRAARLSETIVDSSDVDDLFLDDETLGELLKRW